MKSIHHLALLELGRLVCGRYCIGQLRPDLVPVVRTEVAPGELTSALLLHASAVRHRDAVPPLVHRLLGQVETPNQSGLEAAPIKKGLP